MKSLTLVGNVRLRASAQRSADGPAQCLRLAEADFSGVRKAALQLLPRLQALLASVDASAQEAWPAEAAARLQQSATVLSACKACPRPLHLLCWAPRAALGLPAALTLAGVLQGTSIEEVLLAFADKVPGGLGAALGAWGTGPDGSCTGAGTAGVHAAGAPCCCTSPCSRHTLADSQPRCHVRRRSSNTQGLPSQDLQGWCTHAPAPQAAGAPALCHARPTPRKCLLPACQAGPYCCKDQGRVGGDP